MRDDSPLSNGAARQACGDVRIGGLAVGLAMAAVLVHVSWGGVTAEWEEVAPRGVVPAERRGVRGVFDGEHERLVFQGGETASARFLPDTWYFELPTQTWIQPSIANPRARCHHTFLPDPERGRSLVFGGFPRNNELWSFDHDAARWTNITPAPNPLSPRCLHAAVICEARDEMIVYGGLVGGFAPDLDDTWSLNLTNHTWTQVATPVNPGPRYGAVAALDSTRDRMLLFGGLVRRDREVREANDLWAFDLATRQWARLTAANSGPSPRQFARGVTLRASEGLLLFGGLGQPAGDGSEGRFKHDLWFLHFPTLTWHRIGVEGPGPAARFRHTMVLDEMRMHLYLCFGEGEGRQHFNDLWRLDLTKTPLRKGEVQVRLRRASGGGVNLSWQAESRTVLADISQEQLPRYQVLSSGDLVSWDAVGPEIDAAADPAPTYTVEVPATNAWRFYRVRADY